MSKRSTAARLFRGLWLAADGTRKVLHLFLLLFVFSVVLGALSASAPKLPEQAALVIRPVGDLVEQLEGDPFERALNQSSTEEFRARKEEYGRKLLARTEANHKEHGFTIQTRMFVGHKGDDVARMAKNHDMVALCRRYADGESTDASVSP